MKRSKPPRPPRSICSSWLRWAFGIVSPSLLFLRSWQPEVAKYREDMAEYRLATRQMTRQEWRRYRQRKKIEAWNRGRKA